MTSTTAPTTDRNGRTTMIAAATLCVVGLAGVVTAIIVASTSHHSHALPEHHSSNGSNSVAPANHVNPPDGPSSSVSTLQRELGQLNYYEGSINGYMTTQTVQAIDNLQRAAGLPQTGSMNAATDAALMQQLTNGDNQMGAN